ncbi:MAG: tetratricopeptide repeat protein [Pirellulaceae bacterium]
MSGRGFFRDRKYLPIRLAFLLAIALPLSWFAWQRWEFSQWMKEARTAISRFDDQRGIELLDRIELRHGKSGQTLWLRARSARHARRYEELQRFADGAMRLGAPATMVERERQLADAQSGFFDTIPLSIAQMLEGSADDFPEVATAIGQGLLIELKFEELGKLVDLWQRYEPKAPMPLVLQALVDQHQQQWGAARQKLEQALELDTDYLPAKLALAESLLQLNQPLPAADLYRQLLPRLIDTQEASWGLAQALVNSGQTEQAIQCMNEALEKNPRQFEMALLLGTTQLQFGRPDEALQTLLPWSRTWPEDVELNYAIGQALQQKGDDRQATNYLTRTEEGRKQLQQLDGLIQMAQQRPQQATPKQQVGSLLMRLKNREEGRFWLESALELEPDSMAVHELLTRYYESIDDTTRIRFHRQRVEEIRKSLKKP